MVVIDSSGSGLAAVFFDYDTLSQSELEIDDTVNDFESQHFESEDFESHDFEGPWLWAPLLAKLGHAPERENGCSRPG